ncbi:MAG TPA: class I SAM-dependent methyltransferase [Candidatus Binataceae bacterium]|nr:class I SAM-dependent methyltransferase [Candidatus Binataceae bacterium]
MEVAMLNLKYLRLKVFHEILTRVQPALRGSRMAEFEKIFAPERGTRVIDLGGTTTIWNLIKTPLDVTIVNLTCTDPAKNTDSHHHFTFVEGDATQLHDYSDNSFDIVFSNSVIEHVGGEPNERKFAGEARRLAPSYYVQTPSVYFPLEAHTGIPFWWAMPRALRARMHRGWEKTLPDWNEMIRGTTVITRRKLQGYFPDGTVKTERILGIPKSYYVYRLADVSAVVGTVERPANL